jgi:NADH dehydrogenase [ubiquinone] 1 alpha subcomplex assembly factor 7
VFDQPGDCDLTANVDFAYLREAVEDLGWPRCFPLTAAQPLICQFTVTVHGPIPQCMFLEKMGLQLRLDSLVRAAKAEARKTAIRDAAERLVNKSGMGTEYKVMGLTTVAKDGGKVWPFL